MVQSTISSGYTKSLAKNALSFGYRTNTDSVTACVTAGEMLRLWYSLYKDLYRHFQTGIHTLRDRTIELQSGSHQVRHVF